MMSSVISFFHLRGVEGEGVISGQLANTGLPEK